VLVLRRAGQRRDGRRGPRRAPEVGRPRRGDAPTPRALPRGRAPRLAVEVAEPRARPRAGLPAATSLDRPSPGTPPRHGPRSCRGGELATPHHASLFAPTETGRDSLGGEARAGGPLPLMSRDPEGPPWETRRGRPLDLPAVDLDGQAGEGRQPLPLRATVPVQGRAGARGLRRDATRSALRSGLAPGRRVGGPFGPRPCLNGRARSRIARGQTTGAFARDAGAGAPSSACRGRYDDTT
jgi:hypothetical protein